MVPIKMVTVEAMVNELGKCLPCKYKVLNLILKTNIGKARHGWCTLAVPSLGRQRHAGP